MEPKNHPIETGTSEPNLHDFGFNMWIFQGVTNSPAAFFGCFSSSQVELATPEGCKVEPNLRAPSQRADGYQVEEKLQQKTTFFFGHYIHSNQTVNFMLSKVIIWL